MKRRSPTASTIDALTLPTSVTVPALVASACLGGVGHGPHRRGEEGDLGVGIGADRVERAELERPRRDGGIAVVTGDVPAAAPEGQPDRPTDQPGADDRCPLAATSPGQVVAKADGAFEVDVAQLGSSCARW